MGAGASNISMADLSVYQRSITKITQDLLASSINTSTINLEGEQIIEFTNGCSGPDCGGGDVLGCNKRGEQKENRYDTCVCGMTPCNKTQPPVITLNGIDYPNPNAYQSLPPGPGSCFSLADKGRYPLSDIEICKDNCSENADKAFPFCTPQESVSQMATINCNINITQVNNQSAATSQAADSQIDAQLSSLITNKFQSEIDKKINQTNKDLNFMQFNSSKERTSLSQSVKNSISNSITAISKNVSSVVEGNKQTIKFTNVGVINCSGCGEKRDDSSVKTSDLMPQTTWPTDNSDGACSIKIDQKNRQTAVTEQKAATALSSIFNSDVLNDISSKYKLAVEQKNAGVNPAVFALPIVMIFVIIIVAIIAFAYASPRIASAIINAIMFWKGNSTASGGKSKFMTVIVFLFLIIILGGSIFLGLLFSCTIPSVADKIGFGCGTKEREEKKEEKEGKEETKEEKGTKEIKGVVDKVAIINGGSGFKIENNVCGWDMINHSQCSPQGINSLQGTETAKNLKIDILALGENGELIQTTKDGKPAFIIIDGGSDYTINSYIYIGSGNNRALLKVLAIKPQDQTICQDKCLVEECNQTMSGNFSCNCVGEGNSYSRCCQTCDLNFTSL
jgi:hypothetical protein